MFDFLFGWSKASKCKKLIKLVQCRLKLVKNKRYCITKQFRADTVQLLKNGYHQAAFQRVDQILRDQSMVEAYDLLGHYCDFIVMNLKYIRKHKDCPNDIKEAVSTLIFSSARFGEFPELMSIRKLFGERYGQKLVMSALQLLPGNLVNLQIKDDIYTKNVADDVKYRLLEEIAQSFIRTEPLYLEYKPFYYEKMQGAKSVVSPISSKEVQTKAFDASLELQKYDPIESEGKIVHVDLASERKKFSEDVLSNNGSPKEQKVFIDEQNSSTAVKEISEESSLEIPAKVPEEVVYLDDIEEIVSAVSKDGKQFQDQRLFMFKSIEVPLHENTYYEKSATRKFGKTSKKKYRRSQDNSNVITSDAESAIYYGRKKDAAMRLQLWKYNCIDQEEKNGDEKELEIQPLSVYPRALTLPAGWPNDENNSIDEIIRSNSLPSEKTRYPHIHPKLPDYDEIAAKFTAMKKANMEGKLHTGSQGI